MKNSEWLSGDEKELNYHLNQYSVPKEYTKQIIQLLNKWKLIFPKEKILDLGCGAGANCYFFAKQYPLATFHGIDINPHYIELANNHKLRNVDYFVGDILNLGGFKKSKYTGILSIQTLSWMENYKESLSAMLSLKPKWVIVTSLFYDGPVDAKIRITDYSKFVENNKPRESFYNIYSLEKFNEYLKKLGYSIKKQEPFISPIDLPKQKDKGMGTYTELKANGVRMQVSGPLLMPWFTILIKEIKK